MKVLLHSRFYPNIGGIESVASLLAHEWHRAGENIVVVSDIQGQPEHSRDFPFPVHHRPNPVQWLRLMRWADLFVHMNVSLKALWPAFVVRRPLVAVNHTYYYSDRSGYRDWRERLKLRVIAGAVNVAVSQSVASRITERCFVIPNPFDASLFQVRSEVPRTKDIVFLGRLVSDKGCDLLIQALGRLAECDLRPLVTVIGDGPERPNLQQMAVSRNLQNQIVFVGTQSPDKIACMLCEHNIMVVPSLWEEPFGVVALEGAASGCVILGSDGGGLPEAIGPCGITFRRGDVSDLAGRLTHLLTHPELFDDHRAAATAHLSLHHPTRVAQRYLQVFERTLRDFQLQPARVAMS